MSKIDEIGLGPIRTEEDYAAALERANKYFKEKAGDEFEVVMGRIEEYEDKNRIAEPTDPLQKCIRILGRLGQLKGSHVPPPWKIVQLQPFWAASFLVSKNPKGNRPHPGTIGAEIRMLSGPSSHCLAKLPEDVEWLLKELISRIKEDDEE